MAYKADTPGIPEGFGYRKERLVERAPTLAAALSALNDISAEQDRIWREYRAALRAWHVAALEASMKLAGVPDGAIIIECTINPSKNNLTYYHHAISGDTVRTAEELYDHIVKANAPHTDRDITEIRVIIEEVGVVKYTLMD